MPDANNEATFVMIPIKRIRPNAYNPNRMTPGQFQEYRAEVRHLNAIPKPIVVREVAVDENGTDLEIVDGAHGFAAANEVGFSEVPCQIIRADDFEARRQCFKRNRHGRDNPVLLGRMFQSMMRVKGISCRKLSKEIGVPEATIRAHLDYVRAVELRNGCAPQEDPEVEISRLSRRQVRTYLRLPERMRDAWLDAGACMDDLDPLFENDLSEVLLPIHEAGLARFVEPGPARFHRSVQYVLSLARWRQDHKRIDNVDDFVRSVAELRLPAAVLELLPVAIGDSPPSVLLPAAKWAAIVEYAGEHANGYAGINALVASGVRVALREAGIDLQTVQGPEVAEMQQLVESAPEFIRAAELLSLSEKVELASIGAEIPDDVAARAKQLSIEHLERRRGAGAQDVARKHVGHEPLIGKSIQDIFNHFVAQLRNDDRAAREAALFDNPKRLLKAALLQLASSDALGDAALGDKPAIDALSEQLQELNWPVFALVATCILRSGCAAAAAARWLTEMRGLPAEPEEVA